MGGLAAALAAALAVTRAAHVLAAAPTLTSDGTRAQLSTVRCLGKRSGTRTCHFRDVFYDLESQRFVAYTDEAMAGLYATAAAAEAETEQVPASDEAGENEDGMDSADGSEANPEPFLELGIYDWRRLEPDRLFRLDFNTTADTLPDVAAACDVPRSLYLFTPYRLDLFGHMLRDNFHHVAANLGHLGLVTSRFELLVWRSGMDDASDSLHVGRKYAPLISEGLSVWEDLVQACASAPEGTGRKLLRFHSLVAGAGNEDLRDIPYHPPCEDTAFIAMQHIAYRNAGLARVPARELPTFKVLFGDKPLDDKRRVVNIDDVAAHLRTVFPHIEVKSLVMSDLDAAVQLAELSTTSFFISPIGSSSFRLIYLPLGAHTVLIGAPEGTVVVPDGGRTSVTPFRESEQCWDLVDYMRIEKYHVSGDEEFEFRYGRENHSRNAYNNFLVWDADTVLDPQRIEHLVRAALEDLTDA